MDQKITLETNIKDLHRIGKSISSRLKRLGIQTVRDILKYLPFRYEDYSRVIKISEITNEESATILGKIEMIKSRRSFYRKQIVTEAIISDDESSIKSIWFYQPYISKIFVPGQQVYLSGRLTYEHGTPQFVSPVMEKADKETLHTARIVPMYSLTEKVTHKQLRFLIKKSLEAAHDFVDWLPFDIKKRNSLAELEWSYQQIHFPSSFDELKKAADRLKFNELFLLQLKILLSKKEFSDSIAPKIDFHEKETIQYVDSLPFSLTNDQKKSAWQILQDISGIKPANRLLEGEVGSGKTVVISIAVFNAALSKYQTVIMAPTEILARQHFQTFLHFFKAYPFRIALFTRSFLYIDGEKVDKKRLTQEIREGKIDIIIGTHALIAKSEKKDQSVKFQRLALAIVDEQHRFGVDQRKVLKKGTFNNFTSPHFISMTATPIPRSLSLVFYGDLNISIIRELPKNRKKIITKIVSSYDRNKMNDFIFSQIQHGRQAYVICPLIDPSDRLGFRSVTKEHERLEKEIFKEFKIGALHGKMKSEEKENIMKSFKERKIDILVSTSVIEVGVDVPNASVMIIEGAWRFGLSQLHQFRGRVGRGEHQSYCFLVNESNSSSGKLRLSAFTKAKDGFELSEMDLQLRGPGEMFGETQSGFGELKIASFLDWQLASLAKKEAEKIISEKNIQKNPELLNKIQNELTLAHFE